MEDTLFGAYRRARNDSLDADILASRRGWDSYRPYQDRKAGSREHFHRERKKYFLFRKFVEEYGMAFLQGCGFPEGHLTREEAKVKLAMESVDDIFEQGLMLEMERSYDEEELAYYDSESD